MHGKDLPQNSSGNPTLIRQRVFAIAMGYEDGNDQLLCAYTRPARNDGAKHGRAILEFLVDRIGQE